MNALFEGLGQKDADRLLKIARKETVAPGTVILAEGENAGRLLLLESGKVEIQKGVGGKQAILGTIRRGDFFGEPGLTGGGKNSFSAVATEACSLCIFDELAVVTMVEKYPRLTLNMAKTLSARLRASNDFLKNQIEMQRVVSNKEIARMYSLVQATQTVNSSLELDRVLELILQEALRITEAERGTIYLVDDSAKEIWARIIAGDEIREIRQPMGKGISGYVAETGETVNIPDAYKDERFNAEFDKKSGFKTINILCVPMRNKTGKIIGVFQLINKRHGTFDFDSSDEDSLKAFSINAALAVENSRLALRMVQTERLSAVGKMAGTIIHDIKNPMATIRLYAQVLRKKAGREDISPLVDEIILQIDRLLNLAQEVLDFSRGVSEMNFQPVMFEGFVSDVIRFLERDFEKRKIAIRQKIEYHGEVEIDPDRMIRAILNIAGNAADAMPDGGIFGISAQSSGGKLTIELLDNGTGMPENVRKRIFEPFVTHGKKTGTGLGMSIVKNIIDEHHGTIEIKSELGKGTKIILELPLTQNS